MAQANTTVVNADQVNRAINEVVIRTLQQCNVNVGNTQIFRVTGNYNIISNILVNQATETQLECFGQTANQVKMATDIANALKVTAESNAQWLIGLALNTTVVDTLQYTEIVQRNLV